MAKFKKRPEIVDAWQFDESAELLNMLVNEGMETVVYSGHPRKCGFVCELVIVTLEGYRAVSLGDWIIKDVQGEFHSCKPDIFKATYSEASE